MPAEPRPRTKTIEYVIGGLCSWHVLTGSICGVLQVLGFNVSLGLSTFIALAITVFALVKIRNDERPQLRALPQDGSVAQLFAQEAGAIQPPSVGRPCRPDPC